MMVVRKEGKKEALFPAENVPGIRDRHLYAKVSFRAARITANWESFGPVMPRT